jgi:CheY-like chemotaxis protein
MQTPSLHKTDLKILVVEDNVLIADTIGDLVESCGWAVIGPVGNLEGGMALLEEARPNGALLDVNLAGTLSFPLATALEALGVPFVFMTGYDLGTIFPREFSAVRRITKPFDQQQIAEVLEAWGRMAGA